MKEQLAKQALMLGAQPSVLHGTSRATNATFKSIMVSCISEIMKYQVGLLARILIAILNTKPRFSF